MLLMMFELTTFDIIVPRKCKTNSYLITTPMNVSTSKEKVKMNKYINRGLVQN